MLRLFLSDPQINLNNTKDGNDQTLLHLACECGHENMIRMLVEEFEGDMCHADCHGKTPQDMAREHGHEGALKVLTDMSIPSRPFIPYEDEFSNPLHFATSRNHYEIVHVLTHELGISMPKSSLK